MSVGLAGGVRAEVAGVLLPLLWLSTPSWKRSQSTGLAEDGFAGRAVAEVGVVWFWATSVGFAGEVGTEVAGV